MLQTFLALPHGGAWLRLTIFTDVDCVGLGVGLGLGLGVGLDMTMWLGLSFAQVRLYAV